MLPRLLGFSALLCTSFAATGAIEPPRATDPRLAVELVAQESDIRTPTAIQIDPRGRIWVLENNTHFRPKNYDGPPADRIVIMDDFGTDGRARRFTEWAKDFRNGMGLLLLGDGEAILSTRSETLRLRDTDGDGRADERTTLLKLDTRADYPHNGLSAVTRGPDGKLYVGLGENFSNPWTLIGSDGKELHGSDEGAVFRCDLDGRNLEWLALGVWNPFGLAFDDKDRLFALDNDPSGGSLCRLLHIVRGGDYGYRNRYGRTIDHPFVSWFGTLPGTLPPVCLVGEAPTGLIFHRGELLGCTWTEHGLQRFPLEARGHSFTSKPEWVIRGDNAFRPSGVAEAPDGSLVVSDWADGSYDVHGKGRVWRVKGQTLAPVEKTARSSQTPASSEAVPRQSKVLELTESNAGAVLALKDGDPFLVHHAIQFLAERGGLPFLKEQAAAPDARTRAGILVALQRRGGPEGRALLPQFLADADGAVRRAALKWVAEERLTDLQPKLETALAGQPSRATFQAYLATLQMLIAGKPDTNASVAEAAKIALDPARPAELRALALRLASVDTKALPEEKLRELAETGDIAVRVEGVRILARRTDTESQAVLQRIAAHAETPLTLRKEVVAALGNSTAQPETRDTLRALLGAEPSLAREVLRSLRGKLAWSDLKPLLKEAFTSRKDEPFHAELVLAGRSSSDPEAVAFLTNLQLLDVPKPASELSAEAILTAQGDPAAGRRLYFHPNGPRCFTCHAIEGHGVAIGPDLTNVGRLSAAQLLEAIREPSKEIAPAHTQWHVKLRDGKEVVGIDLFEDNKSQITLIDATGTKTKYKIDDIVSREPLSISLMPPGLDALMTTQDLRDLIAFLREPRD